MESEKTKDELQLRKLALGGLRVRLDNKSICRLLMLWQLILMSCWSARSSEMRRNSCETLRSCRILEEPQPFCSDLLECPPPRKGWDARGFGP